MLPTISIELTSNARAILAQVERFPRALSTALQRTLDRENELTVGHIVEQRATGQGPFPPDEGRLGVVTSRYRRSIRPSKAVIEGDKISSAIGTNVKYAGAHEFGVNKTVNVKAHRARNAMVDVLEVKGQHVPRWESYGLAGRKKQVASGFVTVRAHQVRMNLPARAPLQRGIADRVPAYGAALSAAIVAAWSEGGAS